MKAKVGEKVLVVAASEEFRPGRVALVSHVITPGDTSTTEHSFPLPSDPSITRLFEMSL